MITVPSYRHLSARLLTPFVGAELEGVDFAGPIAPAQLAEIRDAWHRFGVVFFRDQRLTPERHVEVGRLLGDPYVVPVQGANHPEHPELLRLHADEHSKFVAGEEWHADISCEPEPVLGAMLHLSVIPPVGGDTLFCNVQEAWRRLSPAMQTFLRGLTAEHDAAKAWVGRFNLAPPPGGFPKAVHPVVACHPVTGEPGLWVNPAFTTRIVELGAAESDAVLRMLHDHVDEPDITCRFTWRPDSVALWDNRVVQHRALFNYWPHRRSGWRYTVRGSAPRPY